MRKLSFAAAIEEALTWAMQQDPRIVILGEDVHMIRLNQLCQFGADRVRPTPISEAAFVGAAVTAAMAGLRPIVEVMLVDFIGPAMDALMNHAAKIEAFSDGRWRVPLVVRAACGGGYGDGGQHEQSLWGWFAHIPGLSVVVPATPEDAGRLLLAALAHEGPVIYLEHKLLADYWLDTMGGASRPTVSFDVPAEGALGPVPDRWTPLPLGQSAIRRQGGDIAIVTLGVSVHRSLAAAADLAAEGVECTVLDLRSVAPLDRRAICDAIGRTKRLLVVDEDYEAFGLSGEVAATALEAGLQFSFARVCTQSTIPYARALEDSALPNVDRIVTAARELMAKPAL